MGNEPIRGIDNDKLDEIILQLYSVKEDLNITFSNIRGLIDELSKYYKSSVGSSYVSKFNSLANGNFETVLDNIDSYANDLKSAKDNYITFDAKLSAQIIEDTKQFSLEGKEGKK